MTDKESALHRWVWLQGYAPIKWLTMREAAELYSKSKDDRK